MSDVLLYNAIAENQKLLKTYIAKTIDPAAVLDISYYANNNIGNTYNSYSNPITNCPSMVRSWKKVLAPFTAPRSNGFKVCDASGNFRCGASCLWTVPAGVTSVQFQLWGPGGGTSGQCCCGGAPFGPTGSYAVANVTVTPGETIQLTSGCAFCCWASQTTPGLSGTATTVCSTTPGILICAAPASSCIPNWRNAISGTTSSSSQLPSNDGCAPEFCSGWNFCWDNASDSMCIPHAFSKSETWSVPCNTRNAIVYGLPSIYPAMVIGSDFWSSACTISAPVFGFENCTCTWATSNGSTSSSTGGCYYNAAQGFQQIPSVGGFAQWACGGTGAIGGDSGGMGMICVSYNCS